MNSIKDMGVRKSGGGYERGDGVVRLVWQGLAMAKDLGSVSDLGKRDYVAADPGGDRYSVLRSLLEVVP